MSKSAVHKRKNRIFRQRELLVKKILSRLPGIEQLRKSNIAAVREMALEQVMREAAASGEAVKL